MRTWVGALDKPQGHCHYENAVRVKIVRELCDGLANCVGVAPTVFQLDDEHKAIVLDPSTVDEDTLWRAAESCTRNAVILEDDEGNQLYP